jgi:hypothetical protein
MEALINLGILVFFVLVGYALWFGLSKLTDLSELSNGQDIDKTTKSRQ